MLTRQDVADVAAAGAQFIVTPAVVDSIDAAAARGIPVAAGAFTATEALAARSRGADVVKLFPASSGGPGYLKALRDPLPDIPFVAVGGVGLDDVAAYLGVGAIGVGVGSPLVGDAASGGSLEALRERARAYVAGGAGILVVTGREPGLDVLTVGESMVSFRSSGPLAMGGPLTTHLAGAESNVAIGLSRLGHAAAWVGRVGGDEFGALVLRELRAEGVDVTARGARRRPPDGADVPRAAHLRRHPGRLPPRRLRRFGPVHRRPAGSRGGHAVRAAPDRHHPGAVGGGCGRGAVGGRDRVPPRALSSPSTSTTGHGSGPGRPPAPPCPPSPQRQRW